MEPIIVSKEDYDAGNYPKGVPIMISMGVGMAGRGGLNVGRKQQQKVTITLKKNV